VSAIHEYCINVILGIFSEGTGSALACVTISERLILGPATAVPCFPAAITRLDVEIKEIISLSGGARSAAWCQIKSDVTQRQVHTLRASENAACRGAALIAAANLGQPDDLPTIARAQLEFEHHYQPNPEHAAVYERLFE